MAELQTSSLEEIQAVAREMEGFPCPWFVSGGWAIDLFVGQVTRRHEDREIGIFRRDQRVLQAHLAGRALFKAVSGPDGGEYVPWEDGEWLALPIHQILVRPAGSDPPREAWDPMPDEFEFFLNEAEDGLWRCRRDLERITRLAEEIWMRSCLGMPILVPEIQLLFKAKGHRPKDEHDFQQALGLLTAAQRAWLREALAIVHPSDPWLEALE
jgi:hypothetical protein